MKPATVLAVLLVSVAVSDLVAGECHIPGQISGATPGVDLYGRARLTYKQYPNNQYCHAPGANAGISVHIKLMVPGDDGECHLCTDPVAECQFWAPNSQGNYDDSCSTSTFTSEFTLNTDMPGDESSQSWGPDPFPHIHYACCCGDQCSINKFYMKEDDWGSVDGLSGGDSSNVATKLGGTSYSYNVIVQGDRWWPTTDPQDIRNTPGNSWGGSPAVTAMPPAAHAPPPANEEEPPAAVEEPPTTMQEPPASMDEPPMTMQEPPAKMDEPPEIMDAPPPADESLPPKPPGALPEPPMTATPPPGGPPPMPVPPASSFALPSSYPECTQTVDNAYLTFNALHGHVLPQYNMDPKLVPGGDPTYGGTAQVSAAACWVFCQSLADKGCVSATYNLGGGINCYLKTVWPAPGNFVANEIAVTLVKCDVPEAPSPGSVEEDNGVVKTTNTIFYGDGYITVITETGPDGANSTQYMSDADGKPLSTSTTTVLSADNSVSKSPDGSTITTTVIELSTGETITATQVDPLNGPTSTSATVSGGVTDVPPQVTVATESAPAPPPIESGSRQSQIASLLLVGLAVLAAALQ